MLLSQTKKKIPRINGIMLTPITGRIISEYSFRKVNFIKAKPSLAVPPPIKKTGGKILTLKIANHFQS